MISLRAFETSGRRAAQTAKLELELDLHRRGIEHEVVFIEAESEADLRRSYRRYFEDLRTLLQSSADSLETTGK
jgi:hypothetical protein